MRALWLAAVLLLAGCGAGNFHRIPVPHGDRVDQALYVTEISRAGDIVVADTIMPTGEAVLTREQWMTRVEHLPEASAARMRGVCPAGFERVGEALVTPGGTFTPPRHVARYRCRA